jgi:DNA-binding MarR family transcriptional regulator
MNAPEMPAARRRHPAPPTAQDVVELRRHPKFPQAFELMMGDLVRVYRSNRILNQVLNDRARLAFGILVLYLHYSEEGGGLTASRIKTLCTEAQLCSPGRASAMLSLMRFAGYLAPAEHGLDKRIKLLVPTERLLDDQRERLRGDFRAVALLRPEGAIGLERIDDPAFVAHMACYFGETFRSGFRLLQYAPELFPFAERNAGVIILMSLLLAREPDDTMPPARPVTVSISALSKRFAVSRPHVLKLLRDIAAAGFIRLESSEAQRIAILPKLVDELQSFLATGMLILVACVRASLARMEQDKIA